MRSYLLAGAALAVCMAGPSAAQVRPPEGPFATPPDAAPYVPDQPDTSYAPNDREGMDAPDWSDDRAQADEGGKPDDEAGTCDAEDQGALDDEAEDKADGFT